MCDMTPLRDDLLFIHEKETVLGWIDPKYVKKELS